MTASFIFGGNTGETPESIKQKRQLANMIRGEIGSPKNWGEGFNAIAKGLVSRWTNDEAEEGQRAGSAQADDVRSRLIASITGQGAPTPSYGGGASGAAPSSGGGDFMSGLINSESGGNWGALNSEGYGGRLQFGDARLADAANAGVIAPGTTGAAFSRMSPEQQQAVEAWHFGDIDQQAANMGLDQYFGQTIAGVPINAQSVQAMAHLGGIGGVQKFITSGGQHNPADSNGTRLSDYGGRFGGGGQAPQPTPAPVQVASLGDASAYAPQTAPQAIEGAFPQAGGPQAQLPPIAPPQQVAQAPMQPQMAPGPTQQPQGGPDMAMLMEAISSPWLDEGTKAMAMQELQRLQQQQDPAYQQSLRAGDLGIQKSEFELNALLNPAPAKPDYGFMTMPDGTLVRTDGTSGDINSMGQFAPAPEPGFTQLDPSDPRAANLDPRKAYQVGPDNKIYEIGGGGTNVTVNNSDGAPGLGKLSTDYGYVTDPATGMPKIDPATGLPTASAIPGSPAAMAAQQAAEAASAQSNAGLSNDVDKATTTLATTKSVLDLIDSSDQPVTGTLSRPFALMSGTPAGKVRSYVSTLQSGVALGAMQKLKEASATGATGFGALSEKELSLLISDIGALDPDNTEPEIFRQTVQRIEDRSKRVIHDIVRNVSPERIQELGLQDLISTYGGDAAQPAPNQSQAPSGGIDALLEKYQ